MFETFEHINLEILNKKNIVNLTIVYRPPTISGKRKENEFIDEFSSYLAAINDVEKKPLYVEALIYGWIPQIINILVNLMNSLIYTVLLTA